MENGVKPCRVFAECGSDLLLQLFVCFSWGSTEPRLVTLDAIGDEEEEEGGGGRRKGEGGG